MGRTPSHEPELCCETRYTIGWSHCQPDRCRRHNRDESVLPTIRSFRRVSDVCKLVAVVLASQLCSLLDTLCARSQSDLLGRPKCLWHHRSERTHWVAANQAELVTPKRMLASAKAFSTSTHICTDHACTWV